MRQRRSAGAMLICLLMVYIPVIALAGGVVEPTEDFYVADYANVLDDQTEDYIIAQNKGLEKRTGAQIVVVTVDFLDDMESGSDQSHTGGSGSMLGGGAGRRS